LKKVLVTGAAGFLGYHLSLRLHQAGYELTLCDNFTRGKKDSSFDRICEQKGARFLDLDLTNQKSFQELGNSYDAVYHLAAINGTRFFYEKPDQVLRTNLLSTIYLLDWFKNSRSKKFIFTSSSETYAGTIELKEGPLPTPEKVPLCIPDIFNPRFSYAGSKIAGELLVVHYGRQQNFATQIVRYHNVYGPRMGKEHVIPQFILRALAKEDPFKIFGQHHKRSFCYVSDAIEATIQLAECDRLIGEIVHIGNPKEEIEMIELAEKICKLAQWQPKFEIHPAPEGSVSRRLPDTRKMEEELHFKPQIDLTTGLNKTYEWYLKNS